jgi:regulator of RNase E activity RraA
VNIPQLSDSDLKLLGRYDTPTICNVIEVFQVRPQTSGYMDGRIRACFPEMPPMVGYASTATFRSAAAPRGGKEYGGLEAQVEGFSKLPQPVVVVVQDIDSPPVAATFGEVMTTIYKGFGASGLITSGAARDLDQVRALGFPCFSDGVICSHGYPHLLELEVPVNVGGITIHPGDLIHGDTNGVTTIPHDIASEVAHACADFAAAEQVILDYIKAGGITPAGLRDARGECVAMIKALGERVRAKAG